MPALLLKDVVNFAPVAEGVADTTLQLYIDTVADADDCLSASGISTARQKLLKLNAIMHLIVKAQGGQVSAERDHDGASVNYEIYKTSGYGLESTTYGQVVASSGLSCFNFIDEQPSIFMQSVGRSC